MAAWPATFLRWMKLYRLHMAISSDVRKQPAQNPVVSSMAQTSTQGEPAFFFVNIIVSRVSQVSGRDSLNMNALLQFLEWI